MRPTRYKSHFSCHVDRKYLSGLNLDRKYHVETINRYKSRLRCLNEITRQL